MTNRLGASATQAALALAAFWGMVTLGRVAFALIDRWLPARVIYHVLPFVLVAAFVGIGALAQREATAGIAVFGLAGLGCSALLPLTISFGEEELTAISAAVVGGVFAFYQVGYGIGPRCPGEEALRQGTRPAHGRRNHPWRMMSGAVRLMTVKIPG
jgi:hypothetical protein